MGGNGPGAAARPGGGVRVAHLGRGPRADPPGRGRPSVDGPRRSPQPASVAPASAGRPRPWRSWPGGCPTTWGCARNRWSRCAPPRRPRCSCSRRRGGGCGRLAGPGRRGGRRRRPHRRGRAARRAGGGPAAAGPAAARRPRLRLPVPPARRVPPDRAARRRRRVGAVDGAAPRVRRRRAARLPARAGRDRCRVHPGRMGGRGRPLRLPARPDPDGQLRAPGRGAHLPARPRLVRGARRRRRARRVALPAPACATASATALGFVSLGLTPSKWTHHSGRSPGRCRVPRAAAGHRGAADPRVLGAPGSCRWCCRGGRLRRRGVRAGLARAQLVAHGAWLDGVAANAGRPWAGSPSTTRCSGSRWSPWPR